MLFNSLEYLIYLPIVLILYYVVPKKLKNSWLVLASYFFYICWNAKYILLILSSTVVTYLGALLIERFFSRRKMVLFLVVAFNVSLLFIFKYLNFVLSILGTALSCIGIRLMIPSFDIVLPVGISFYCFQAMGYTIDVYRGETKAEKNFLQYALFVSFFPQLVAGPIERSKNLLGQLSKEHAFDYERFVNGILIMIWGYFLKVVIADRIAIFVDVVYKDYASYPGMYLIIATILFAFQIYCDFYGYSTIAVGSAMMLGIDLMQNFNAPYLATSVADFWRGWHISLTTWFKDYVYIPLGGNRKGMFRSYINKMIVFLLSGLWHGASLSFVVWGGLNGLYQVIGSALPSLKKMKADSGSALNVLRIAITFVLVDFSWIFFRANRLRDAFEIIKSIMSTNNAEILSNGAIYACGLDKKNMILLMICLSLLFVADLMKKRGILINKAILSQNYWVRGLVIAISISLIMLFGKWGPSFEQANFIYFQF